MQTISLFHSPLHQARPLDSFLASPSYPYLLCLNRFIEFSLSPCSDNPLLPAWNISSSSLSNTSSFILFLFFSQVFPPRGSSLWLICHVSHLQHQSRHRCCCCLFLLQFSPSQLCSTTFVAVPM